MSDQQQPLVVCFGCEGKFPPEAMTDWRDQKICPVCTRKVRQIAFEGAVELYKWEDSSTSGPKARFLLNDRDALKPFEKATKRRGKRAGQRYRFIVCTAMGEHLTTTECFLAGAQWAHGSGASITLAFESIEYWRQYSTGDHAEGEGAKFLVTMVELDDDEQPIDQVSREAVETAVAKKKGGPKSKFVAQRNQSREFLDFVAYRLEMPPDKWQLCSEGTADKWVKKMTNVQSKIEFDHDPGAWDRYERLVSRPFMSWARAHFGDRYAP